MISISLKHSSCNANIPIKRRITYMRGDSGEGKTSIFSCLQRAFEEPEIEVAVSNGYTYATMTNDLNTALSMLRSMSKTIIVSDDQSIVERREFIKCVKDHLVQQDNYLLIINRADELQGTLKSLDYSLDSILVAKRNGVNVNFYGEFDSEVYSGEYSDCSFSDAKCLFVEDRYGLQDLASGLKTNNTLVLHAKRGKTSFAKDLADTLEKSSVDNILLFPDLAVFGGEIGDLKALLAISTKTYMLDLEYECFEYLLCKSNIVDVFISDDEANKYLSWEKYYEKVLEKAEFKDFNISNGYVHSNRVPMCIRTKCSSCKRGVSGHCDKKLDGSKLAYLFSKTSFEYLIDILEG